MTGNRGTDVNDGPSGGLGNGPSGDSIESSGSGPAGGPDGRPTEGPGGRPTDEASGLRRRWGNAPFSRQSVLLIAVIVLAFYLISQFAVGPEGMGCAEGLMGRTQWSQEAVGARLTDLWSRGSEGFDVVDAELTHLTVAWAVDGSMIQLELQGTTSVGLRITVSSTSPSGRGTMIVYSDAAALGTSTTSTGSATPTTEAAPSEEKPLLADILASLDAIGFEGLVTATSPTLGDEEGLMLELEGERPSQPALTIADYAGETRAFTVFAGDLAPAEGAVAVASLAPSQVFALSKAQTRGSGASVISPPLAYLFVR